jgi:hypothetical protein
VDGAAGDLQRYPGLRSQLDTVAAVHMVDLNFALWVDPLTDWTGAEFDALLS